MKRRSFLQTAALAPAAPLLGFPRIGKAASLKTLRFIPQADLTVLDPVWTTAYVTRNHAMAVFDTLFGIDSSSQAQPQMCDGVQTGHDWKLVLRDGLTFHDGTPVLSRDCVASIRRWAKRDAFGQAVMAFTDELSAPDDRTILFRMKLPFPLLPSALGKLSSNMLPIMPERLAKIDAFTQVTEMVGSGPFRFKADEQIPGARIVYERFENYRPRSGDTADWTAGPKIAHFDRIEWTVIPDAATALAALQNGEVDWWEQPTFDLLPLLSKNPRLAVETLDPSGYPSILRFNQLHPPFDNPAIRRVLLGAVDQTDFMTAVAGTDTTMWKGNVGFFPPGSPLESDVGLSVFAGDRDFTKVKADLAAAGYKGERIVVMVASDVPVLNAMGEVGVDMLRKAGMTVDEMVTDWGSVIQRRASRNAPDKGGWNVFFTAQTGLDQSSPASHVALRGNGTDGWFGWPTDPRMEGLRTDWLTAPDPASQKRIGRDMQALAFQDVPYLPLGEYFQRTAYLKSLKGVLKGLPLFWNVDRA